MMINKTLKILILITFFSLPAFAELEDDYFVCSSKKEIADNAKIVLTNVQNAYQEAKSFRASFVQDAYLAALDVSERSFGKVWYEKPGSMRWSYKDPEEQELLIKDNTFWYYQPELEQVRISKLKDVFLTDMPVSFLLGIGKLSKDFKADYVCDTKAGKLLSLSPIATNGSKEVKKFLLSIIKDSSYPQAAKIDHPGGNKTVIVLQDLEYGFSADKEVFKLNIPSNIDVIDDREKQ